MAAGGSSPQRSSQLFREIEEKINSGNYDESSLAEKLVELKVIARDPGNAPEVYCMNGISLLGRFALDGNLTSKPKSSLEAARIIANALLLQSDLRQCFADSHLVPSTLGFYAIKDYDHEFVGARILFLLTYDTNIDFTEAKIADQICDTCQMHLANHVMRLRAGNQDQMAFLALVETLKLVFNLGSKDDHLCQKLKPTIPSLCGILANVDIPDPPLQPPVAQILNALALLPLESLVPDTNSDTESHLHVLAEKSISCLQGSVTAYTPAQLETQLIPLLAVIRNVYIIGSAHVKAELQTKLLPADSERDKPLGQSSSLASQLLRLQSSPGVMNLPEAISGLLYELSDRDATRFVQNIGYGHAAGYLMTHKIPIPEELRNSMGDGHSDQPDVLVNPITGQRLDAEQPVNMPEMTEEEKEREAERLFVLFERLRQLGVTTVQNPVRQAAEAGRFEEVPDSDPE